MTALLKQICETNELQYISSSSVNGGDINQAYVIHTSGGKLFVKLNGAVDFPEMFVKEADGLNALSKASKLKVPQVIAVGEVSDHQYLSLEWLEKAAPSPAFWEEFALGMAELHQVTNSQFGWHTSNYIGSLVQQNCRSGSWSSFYANQRMMPLVIKLFNAGAFTKADVGKAEKLCERLNQIFPNEPPALLHGDLWAGNFMAAKHDTETIPCIYDPAVYFGNREMDLGMSLLFGGFDNRFYEAYHSFLPLENNWRKRVSLTQLYPLLVHAVLFGGGYFGRCKEIISAY